MSSTQISIKKCFTSRWGDDGYIVEADFSQLEVIGAAFISNDPMMKKDILDGVDSHSQSASWLNPTLTYDEIRQGYLDGDKTMTKLRKDAKSPRFELIYGAGAKSISENNNIPIKTAKGFIDRYYERYCVLAEYQQMVIDTVKASRVPTGTRSPLGVQLGMGSFTSITGRRYNFMEKDAPDWMRERDGTLSAFSPTEAKNYPMQGFSTGDIVPEVLGRVHQMIANNGELWVKCLPINTIHDSIIFDIHKDILHIACNMIKYQMEQSPYWMKERFGIEIDLPMKVDVEYGHSWDSMSTWHAS